MSTQDKTEKVAKDGSHTYKRIYVNFMKQISPYISCFFCLICVAALFTSSFGPVFLPCILCTAVSTASTQLQDNGKTVKEDEIFKDSDLKK